MKKTLSIVLSIVLLASVMVGIGLTASAEDEKLIPDDATYIGGSYVAPTESDDGFVEYITRDGEYFDVIIPAGTDLTPTYVDGSYEAPTGSKVGLVKIILPDGSKLKFDVPTEATLLDQIQDVNGVWCDVCNTEFGEVTIPGKDIPGFVAPDDVTDSSEGNDDEDDNSGNPKSLASNVGSSGTGDDSAADEGAGSSEGSASAATAATSNVIVNTSLTSPATGKN